MGIEPKVNFNDEKDDDFVRVVCNSIYNMVSHGGAGYETSDLKSIDHGFNFRPFHFHVMTVGKLFTHTHISVIKQYNLVPDKG